MDKCAEGQCSFLPYTVCSHRTGRLEPTTDTYEPWDEDRWCSRHFKSNDFVHVWLWILFSELARCQSNLTELSRLLQSLEILQRTQSAPNFTEMQVKKKMQAHKETQAQTVSSFRKHLLKSQQSSSLSCRLTGISCAPWMPASSSNWSVSIYLDFFISVFGWNSFFVTRHIPFVFATCLRECLLLPFHCNECVCVLTFALFVMRLSY